MNLSVAAAGARLLAKSAHIQKSTLITPATHKLAGHFNANLNHAVIDAFLLPVIPLP
jgi:hypothetical protein